MKPVTDKQILIAARKLIKNRHESYICHAIDDCNRGTTVQKNSLRRWVRKLLQGQTTYTDWLGTFYPTAHRRMGYPEYQQGRLQWLDWMIANCGDK